MPKGTPSSNFYSLTNLIGVYKTYISHFLDDKIVCFIPCSESALFQPKILSEK